VKTAVHIIEKDLVVTRWVTKKRYKDKEYSYDYGQITVKLPREFIGRKVRVIVIPIE